eukprot:gene11241-13286_t
MYLVDVGQDSDGIFTVKSFKPIDWSSYGGIWHPCAGSLPPWGSHLGSEEYEPDARTFTEASNWTHYYMTTKYDDKVRDYMKYFGLYENDLAAEGSWSLVTSKFHPYLYGYLSEVTVDVDGEYTVYKRFATGRKSIELGYVMPDRKTTFVTDDGTNTLFTAFIADQVDDLSAGHLYCARVTQEGTDTNATTTAFEIDWIPMGHASDKDDELLSKAKTTSFSDLFETTEVNSDASCLIGFTSTNAGAYGQECLKLKNGMEKLASRFETRRYGAYLGCTTEFSKMEGITFSENQNLLYMTISDVRYGMENNQNKGLDDDQFDVGGSNDIKLDYNKADLPLHVQCGCVYGLSLKVNTTALGQYTPARLLPLRCGIPSHADADNACSVDDIASPDNAAFVEDHHALVIGEDTDHHQNDVVWLYNLHTLDTAVGDLVNGMQGATVANALRQVSDPLMNCP